MHYHQPKELDRALELLSGFEGQVVAGGTDLFPSCLQGPQPKSLLDITSIAGFSDIAHCNDTVFGAHIRIGAAVTWSALIKADLPRAFNGLKQAAREVGSIQIQNAGTIAGNLCNASPAADGVPALLALDASVELADSARRVRRLKLYDFITGVRETVLKADEIITAILVPAPGAKALSAFDKLGSRKFLVISISMVAANLTLDDAGALSDVKIAVGACSPVAQRLLQLEQDLIGHKPSNIVLDDHHFAPLSPINDVRGSKAFRLDVVREQVIRTIHKAASVQETVQKVDPL